MRNRLGEVLTAAEYCRQPRRLKPAGGISSRVRDERVRLGTGPPTDRQTIRNLWRVEQTLFALCSFRHGKGGFLPKTYEVSLNKHSAENCVARHYVGAVRDRFYGEGLSRLREVLLTDEEKS